MSSNTQGQMGYMIQQTLQNKLRDMNIDREVVSLITQVIVDKNDESINNPTKYIGPRYSKKDIRPLSNKFNWKINTTLEKPLKKVVKDTQLRTFSSAFAA